MMRVSSKSLYAGLLTNLQSALRDITDAQEQLTTGKRINAPSDDPIGVARLMSYKSGLRTIASEESGLESATTWLAMTEQTLGQITDVANSARANGLSAISSTNEDARDALATQVDAAIEQVVAIANGQLRGRYMLSGTATRTAPVEYDGASASYQGSGDPLVQATGSGTWLEVGVLASDGICAEKLALTGTPSAGPVSESTTLDSLGITPVTIRVSLGETSVAVDCSGATTVGELLDALEGSGLQITARVTDEGAVEISAPTGAVLTVSDEGAGDAAVSLGVAGSIAPEDVLGCLIRLRDAIRGGDAQEITDATNALETSIDDLVAQRGRVGARQQRAELALTRAGDAELELASLESTVEDADLAELATRLSLAQSVYQAALASVSSAMEYSLADFL